MSVRELSSSDWFRGVLCAAVITAVGTVCPANAAGDDAATPASASPPPGARGSWVAHDVRFVYQGFTATYSCNGLVTKLEDLLRLSGADKIHVQPRCGRPFDEPDRLAQADVRFSTLEPAASGATWAPPAVAGAWRHVTVTPQTLHDSLDEECELVQQFRNVLLPMFTVRNVRGQFQSCVPNQDLGPFSLTFDVFAPPAKSGRH